ncbi:MAG TPA: VanZ family protein [Longimicrobiales bacterium]|nr:VanZ family protein [Longimicrobiales bacterium]
MRRKLSWYLPAALWAAFVLFIGSRPNLMVPVSFPGADKVGHSIMYGVLALLVMVGGRQSGARRPWLWALLVVAIVAAGDELHQRIVPGRDSDIFDWVADMAGALVGVFVVRLFAGKRRAGRNEP